MSKAKNLATFGDNVDSSGNITDLNVDSNTLVVDAANNRVGIGTAPNKKLHVYRNDNSTDAQILVEQAGIGDATVNFLKTGVYAWMTGIDNTDNKYKISGTGDDLNTNNYLAIDTNGFVGIGTSSPAYRLEVAGNLRAAGNLIVDGVISQQLTDGTNLWTDINSGANPYTPMDNELVIRNDALDVTNSMASIFFRAGQTTAGLQINTARIAAVREAGIDTSLAFSTRATSGGHTEKMRITSDGNVGIGTTSPAYRFAVVGSGGSWGNTERIVVQHTSTGQASLDLVNTEGYFRIINDDGALKVYDQTDAAYRLTIDTNGNVGIGTSSPSAPLDVAGNIFISADTTESVRLTIGNGRSGDGYSYVDLVGDATYTEYGLRMIRNNTGANANSDIYHRGTGALRISAQDAGSVQLRTQNTNRFQVDSTGRIQMVTSNLLTDGEGSNFNVSINGYVGVSSSLVAGVGSGAVALSINDGKGNANLTFNHHSGTPDVTGNSFRIETNVDATTGGTMVFEGLSTTTAGVDVNLNMMATMYADTGNMTINGSLTQNSDLRIKKDLQIIPNALDKLKTLNGYIYTRTDRPMEFQQTGCVAQEVQAVLPEAVVVGEDEQQTLSIAYGSMVGLLVEAIKELEAKVAALESGA